LAMQKMNTNVESQLILTFMYCFLLLLSSHNVSNWAVGCVVLCCVRAVALILISHLRCHTIRILSLSLWSTISLSFYSFVQKKGDWYCSIDISIHTHFSLLH
jgi:hypothetical protein